MGRYERVSSDRERRRMERRSEERRENVTAGIVGKAHREVAI